MARFRYRCVDHMGRTEAGVCDAASKDAALEGLRARGLLPLALEPSTGSVDLAGLTAGSGPRLGLRQLALMTRSLATLLEAGLDLDQALLTASRSSRDRRARNLLEALRSELRSGASLTATLEKRTDQFEAAFVALVRAGEASGTLGDALEEIADLLERRAETRERLRSALAYPVVLVLAALLSIAVIILGVLPSFSDVIASDDASLPWLTIALVSLGLAVEQNGRTIVAVALVFLLLLAFALSRPTTARALREAFFRVRGIRSVRDAAAAAAAARVLASLLRGGVPVLSALQIAAVASAPAPIEKVLKEAGDRVRQGGRLAEALSGADCVPPALLQLVVVGERSGQLPAMLIRAAGILEHQARQDAERLLALLAPAATLFAGALVAVVVISMMGAVFGVYGTLP